MSNTPSSLPCPQCKKLVLIASEKRPASFPFCCERCRLIDLGAWSDGDHAIAGTPVYQPADEDDYQ